MAELTERAELLFAGSIIEPVPIVAAAEDKMAVQQDGEVVFVFVFAQAQHREIVGRQQIALFAAAQVVNVERARSGPAGRHEIEPPPIGAKLLGFEVAELALGIAPVPAQQQLVVFAVDADLAELIRSGRPATKLLVALARRSSR